MINIPDTRTEIPNDLSKELAQTIDSRKDTITVLDSDIKRLQKLGITEQRNLVSLSTQKDDLSKQIVDLEQTIKEKKNELGILILSIESYSTKRNSLKSEIESIENDLTKKKGVLDTREQDLISREHFNNQFVEELEQRKEDISKRENELLEKHQAIKELAAKLT